MAADAGKSVIRFAMARLLFIALLCTIAILGSSGLASPDGDETGSISGKVTDEDGKPVRNAVVIIMNKRRGTSTDSTGTYTLRSIPVGAFTLRASSYRAGRSQKAGVQVAAGKTTAVDFVLTRSSGAGVPLFTGAYDPCDDPMEGDPDLQSLVQIGVRSENRAGAVTYVYKVLNRSRAKLTEIRLGYNAGRARCELSGFFPHVVPDTALAPPGWACTPVQGEDPMTFALSWKVITGRPGIPPDSWLSGFTVILPKGDSLYANCHWLAGTGSLLESYAGRVRPGREVDAIRMATGTIVGKVTDQSGTSISGATIGAWYAGPTTTSASDGTYILSAVPVGEYTLMARMSGYERCAKGHVRVAAGKTSRMDFHLSTGALSIPCNAYSTYRERSEVQFPRGVLDHDVEVVYRGLGQDTTTRAFVATVHREFRDPAEERLLRIAEETYPPTKAVLSIADDRLDRKALLQEKRLWWYGEFDGVRLPYAVTMDAVRYYLSLTQALGRGESSQTHGIRMKASQFSYSAHISPEPKTFSRGGRVFEDVWVVEMRLEWSDYCGSLCACGFSLDRTVLLRRDGTVVCVFGDRKPIVGVS
jgi:protocatechuate 3,4-dioxygenase beta subunit